MPRLALLVFAGFFSTFAAAQDYPSRPITMVVPFPPGGVADIVGRPLAAMMEKSLKQPVVIVNRTGAGGALGMRVPHCLPARISLDTGAERYR